jgi:hypothetical protein
MARPSDAEVFARGSLSRRNTVEITVNMKAFVCVYRHPVTHRKKRLKVEKAAEGQPLLRKFLAEYPKSTCFYDWGDDPAFFCAKEILGHPTYATWGVCRRPVRNQLARGHLVIFFCGRQSQSRANIWDYYFIGFGTVKEAVSRRKLWEDGRYSRFRDFYNTLAKPAGDDWIQHELFGSKHSDWRFRSSAPYIIFEESESLTDFNLTNPLHVATKLDKSPLEKWHSGRDALVKRLEDCLFVRFGISRRLRVENHFAHPQIAIHSQIIEQERASLLNELRTELAEIARLASVRNSA